MHMVCQSPRKRPGRETEPPKIYKLRRIPTHLPIDPERSSRLALGSNRSFIALTCTQLLGAFNDNVFRQFILLIALNVTVSWLPIDGQSMAMGGLRTSFRSVRHPRWLHRRPNPQAQRHRGSKDAGDRRDGSRHGCLCPAGDRPQPFDHRDARCAVPDGNPERLLRSIEVRNPARDGQRGKT